MYKMWWLTPRILVWKNNFNKEEFIFKDLLFLGIKPCCDANRLTRTGHLLHHFKPLKCFFKFFCLSACKLMICQSLVARFPEKACQRWTHSAVSKPSAPHTCQLWASKFQKLCNLWLNSLKYIFYDLKGSHFCLLPSLTFQRSGRICSFR